ncbi:2'-5' RNA ligase superfamily-domain-containing protein, partial [Dendryphion nanum]
MSRLKTASHLSHKCALVLLPPSSIAPPIESVRRIYDKHFARWPPHVNLIYPFLASPSDASLSEHIDGNIGKTQRSLKSETQRRIQKVIRQHPPFKVNLRTDPSNVFSHSKKSKTVWLDPEPELDALSQLQAALQAEFAECDADVRPFRPHLSVGQASSDKGALALVEEMKDSIRAFLSENSDQKGISSSLALNWEVDQVFVIERIGFHGRFNIIGTVDLGE